MDMFTVQCMLERGSDLPSDCSENGCLPPPPPLLEILSSWFAVLLVPLDSRCLTDTFTVQCMLERGSDLPSDCFSCL